METTIRELLLINKKPWRYKKLDDLTVRIVTPTPFGPFLDMVGFPIMPEHKLETAWKTGQFNATWGVNTQPSEIVGTGPFVLASYKPSENITFKRNPYYWKLAADGKQLPFLDGGAFQLVPDINTLTLKFRARELDFTSLRAEDWDSFRKGEDQGGYKTMDLGPDWGMTYLSFNQNPRATTVPAYKRAWFSKKEFRQAVAYAIDREAMVKTALRGLGRPLWSPVSEANKLYFDPAVKHYPYDPAKARALLSSIGLSKTNADGILEDAAGHPVEFTLITNSSNNVRVALCTMIQSDLKKIGMKVDVTPVEFNALTTRLTSSYDWEAHLLGFTGGPEPYAGKSIWTTPGIHHLWNPRQSTPATPWEAEIDRIFARAGQTVDPKQRAKLYNRWQEIAADEAPLIFLVTPDALAAVRNRLTNLKPTSLGIRWNEYEWSER